MKVTISSAAIANNKKTFILHDLSYSIELSLRDQRLRQVELNSQPCEPCLLKAFSVVIYLEYLPDHLANGSEEAFVVVMV